MTDEDQRRRIDAISRPAALTWLPVAEPTTAAAPAPASPAYREWEDPTCFAIGKEPAHAALFGCESRAVALGLGRDGSTRYQSLNGIRMWSNPSPNPDPKPKASPSATSR